jgi:hypothetical protein
LWVWKLVVKVAIENFSPAAAPGKPDPIAKPLLFLQVKNNQSVLPNAFDQEIRRRSLEVFQTRFTGSIRRFGSREKADEVRAKLHEGADTTEPISITENNS